MSHSSKNETFFRIIQIAIAIIVHIVNEKERKKKQ